MPDPIRRHPILARSFAVAAALCALAMASPAHSFGYTRDAKRYLEPHTGSTYMATGDFDGDGGADVAFCYGGERAWVFSQKPNGSLEATFEGAIVAAYEPKPGYPYVYTVSNCRISAADLNMDGLDDLVISHNQGLLQLLARGDGGFDRDERNIELMGGGSFDSHGGLDVTGDGIKDILLHTYGGSTISYVSGNSDGSLGNWGVFKSVESSHQKSDMAIGDLNSDGLPDLALVGSKIEGFTFERISSLELFMNTGAGTFQALPRQMFLPGSAIEHARIADVNGDGRNDLVVTANVGSALLVFEQQADASLLGPLVYGAYAAPKSFSLTDMDGDGFNDVVVNNVGEYTGNVTGPPGLSTYFQRSGILAFHSQETGFDNNGLDEPDAIAVADFNSDGCKDVLLGDGGAYFRLNAHGCIVPPVADTAVALETLDWRSIVTLRNKPSSAVAAQGMLRVHFVTRTGNFEFLYSPPQCVRSATVARTVTFQCPVTGLGAGQSLDYQFNYSTKRAIDQELRIYATMDGAGFDPTLADNRSIAAISSRVRRTTAPTAPLPEKASIRPGGRSGQLRAVRTRD